MDILLSSFVKKYVNDMDEIQLNYLEKFLDFEDEIIYNFYNFNKNDQNIEKNEISKKFKKFKI